MTDPTDAPTPDFEKLLSEHHRHFDRLDDKATTKLIAAFYKLGRADAAASRAPSQEWRCFHCDEVFTTEDEAREHFGRSEMSTPGCAITVAEFRQMEQHEAAMRRENEEMSNDASMYHQQSAELERLFGKGVRSAHQAWLRWEEQESRAMAAEEALAAGARAVPSDTPLCKDNEHDFGTCKTCGMPWLASRLEPPTANDIAWAARSIHDLDVAPHEGPRGIHVGKFETCDAPSCAAVRACAVPETPKPTHVEKLTAEWEKEKDWPTRFSYCVAELRAAITADAAVPVQDAPPGYVDVCIPSENACICSRGTYGCGTAHKIEPFTMHMGNKMAEERLQRYLESVRKLELLARGESPVIPEPEVAVQDALPRLAHWCQDEHQQIAHNDSEHERCPLCRALDEIATLKARTTAVQDALTTLRDEAK